MIMELTYLLLNKINMADWSSAQLEFFNKFSQSEIEIIIKNAKYLEGNLSIKASSSWKS